MLNYVLNFSIYNTIIWVEVAFWQAVKKVLPGVTQRGCAFHFTQGVWRNIQAVGLQVAYTKDEAVNRICRKTIALPFLPADCISDAFLELEASGNDIVQVATHLQYVRRQWIDSTTFLYVDIFAC